MTQTLPDTELFTDAQVFAAIAAAMGHHGLDARSIEINSHSPSLVRVNTCGPDHVKAWADTFGVDMTTNETKTSVHYEAGVQIAGRKVTVYHIVVGAAYSAAYNEATDALHAKFDALDDTVPVVEAAKAIDLGKPETTCGRCLIATGAHTFGIGCNARLSSLHVLVARTTIKNCPCCNNVTPGSIHTEVGDCRFAPRAERPELLHYVTPADVAPGEPDDRGWDAPIVPAYVDQLGASA